MLDLNQRPARYKLATLTAELIPHINNPFLSALLFTTEADITLKLNKKRVARIDEQAPTFKNADASLVEFLGNCKKD